ncbi:hypothetical protein [Mesorhizobium escarrei]|uniref:hypothetical protein n=1 Tax=Mesorhizobium escarrei TaxID=666018 RepID=UPI0020A7EE64|nr:hypothetical protein [Mesorhizobium escarrei]
MLQQRDVIHRFQAEWFLFFFLGVYFVAVALYVYELGGMLNFSSLGSIYTQRALFAAAAPSAVALYLTGWLSNAMNPYLLAVGMFDRSRRWLLPIAVAGQVLVFMAFAGKVMLVMLFVVVGFFIFAVKDGRIVVPRLVFGAAALGITVSAILIATGYQPTGVAFDVVSTIFMRTLALQGAMVGVYADVFSDSPLTYWSHSNIVNLFVDYPHKVPLGFVVGMRLAGGSGFNANSSFWGERRSGGVRHDWRRHHRGGFRRPAQSGKQNCHAWAAYFRSNGVDPVSHAGGEYPSPHRPCHRRRVVHGRDDRLRDAATEIAPDRLRASNSPAVR